jgi:ABC-type lipoprotein release transport system permease subunit
VALKLIVQLSWRNLWRYRRRNLMLFSAILVAIASCVLLASLLRGMQIDMMKGAVDNLSGNLKVLAPGYREDPSIERGFLLDDAFQPDVPAAELIGWTRRVRVPAVVVSERETRGVSLIGIDPNDERAISFLGDVKIDGEGLRDADDERILLGAELAARLDTRVGRRVVVMTQGADGRNREAGFRVAGAFDAPGTMLEKAYAFTGIRALQKLLDTHNVTEVSVRLRDDRFTPVADGALTQELQGLQVFNWRQLDPQAAAFFQMADVGIVIWFVILLLALAFGLINSLITAVLERIREFGMLRALGMRRGTVVAQVVVESVLIVTFALAGGIALGIGLVGYFSAGIDLSSYAAGAELAGLRGRLVPHLAIGDVVTLSVLSLVLAVLASAYPAWRAVRIKPLDALGR